MQSTYVHARAGIASRPTADLDLRCAHTREHVPAARCQLLAGHDGCHAAMFCLRGRRAVCRWPEHQAWVCQVQFDDFEALPWTRGLPVPEFTQDHE